MEQLSDLIPLVRWHVYALQSGDKKHILESGNQLDRWLAEWDAHEEVRGGMEVIHLCPPEGSGLMPCCGRTPFEARQSRMTVNPSLVTCKGGNEPA
jgi:hypothetical protein